MGGAVSDDSTLQAAMERVETLLQEIESLPDASLRDRVREIVRSLLDFHAAGLAMILDRIQSAGTAGSAILEELKSDEVTASLLALYDLHSPQADRPNPWPIELPICRS
jgi:hypothetical protein